ncbi:transmembrane protein [Ceratobasidium sp. AG-Ba]|nr:transmembrane protein [Ceratobasidium sp. AG-Ba]QRW06850.1 transmembrane protein [Ceratobasidium sp. AG-Ba]
MYQQLLWNATNLGPGDHQLVISHAGMANQSIALDYLLVESNHGSKPELTGPGASIVPIEAVIVDDNDPRLEYSAGWEPVLPSETMHAYFNNTMHTTNTPGASVTFRFRGTAAWYFSDIQPENGKLNITLDDESSWVLSSNTGQQMQQRMIWNVTGLPNGEHKLVLTHYDQAGTRTTLDFFRF